MALLIVGSVALDSVSTPFGNAKNVLGGSASYCSVSASYFTNVNLVAAIGQDFPKEYLELFKKRGINTDGIKKLPGKTFHWEGSYGNDLNQAHTIKTELNILTARPKVGALGTVFPLPKNYVNSEYVFLANIDPELQLKVLSKIINPKLIACDTMNFWIKNKKTDIKKLLKHVDILTLNEAEIREFSREKNIIKAAKKILENNKEKLQTIIIKRGEHGALMVNKKTILEVPAYPTKNIIDPTGAGDSFAGGLMGYIAKTGDLSQKGLHQAILIGSVMASLNIESFSLDRLKSLTLKEIKQRYTSLIRIASPK